MKDEYQVASITPWTDYPAKCEVPDCSEMARSVCVIERRDGDWWVFVGDFHFCPYHTDLTRKGDFERLINYREKVQFT